MISHMGDVLLYMERRYCGPFQKPAVRPLAGLELRVQVFESTSLGRRLTNILIAYINDMRTLEDLASARSQVPLDGLNAVVNSTLDYETPETRFAFHQVFVAQPLVQASEEWFASDVRSVLQRLNGLEFLDYIGKRLATEPKILDIVGIKDKTLRRHIKSSMIKQYVENILDRLFSFPEISLAQLIPTQQFKTAGWLYQVVHESPTALTKLADVFTEVLTAEGLAILQRDSGRAAIASLTKMRNDANTFLVEAFRDDVSLRKCLRKALEKISCVRQYLSRNLATALHETIQDLEINSANEDLSDRQDKLSRYMHKDILEPFCALRDKDTFEFHYRNDLINRFLNLIARRHVDEVDASNVWGQDAMHLEYHALHFFATECGAAYTQKSHGFFEDLKLSRDFHTARYKGTLAGCVELQAIALSSARWVKETSAVGNATFTSIPTMLLWIKNFESSYKETFHNRKLKWLTEFGRALVRFTPRPGQCVDICCSTAQAMFLLLFEQPGTVMTWEEIKARLEIESDSTSGSHYLRHFMGLAVHKEARFLIIGDDKMKIVQNDDQVSVNLDFTSTRKRVTAKVISMKTKAIKETTDPSTEGLKSPQSNDQENPDTGVAVGPSGLPVSVEQNRNTIVDAAIVRIMKARKKLSHLDLITSLNDALKSQFLPPAALVKERVAYLIDREFLQRDANQHDTYHYIA
eukprot:Blabericola_migrator_1__113@NODE_1029_length_5656_cov_134_262122_g709_i0_p1_GENE_NODE_1029_length_5656_cov_134_262122_g709_i0NODE_1029_length_5656_cov_134_262122_g709_i0_p1_ORF_typecomplete_len813_score133_21Cullin/PF00888_22/9_9e54Cullin_Nedd8/PF10557_9/2_4e02Cullin_Nedd8/PF10557_9/3_9e19Haem_degrading/PF03928_14/6_2e03Haem_degrading/PF03928_14/0_24NLE/PF08154_12/0_58NLE/PF08154_12/6_8e03_NODE_1029_length_5656_cov_134_262122_g709_i03592440